MSSGESGSNRRVRDRIELNRKVHLRFEKFQDFLTEIAGNISPGGMFVRSENPSEVGDLFDFECSLEDGYPLVSGRAVVVWVRHSPTADQPGGMGVRFLELRDKSEMLIRRIVEQRMQAGESTFELEKEPTEVIPDKRHEEPHRSREPLVTEDTSIVSTSGPGGAATSSPASPTASERPSPTVVPIPVDLSLLADSDPSSKPSAARHVTPPPPKASPPALGPPAPTPKPTPGPKPKPPGVRRPSVPGGPLADVSQPKRAPVKRVVGGSPSSPSPVVAGTARKGRRGLGIVRFLELLVFSALVGAFMVLIFNQYWVRPRIEQLEARLEELTGSSRIGGPPGFRRGQPVPSRQPEAIDATRAETAGVAVASAEPAAAEVAVPVEPRQAVLEAVQGWARAWSEQRVEDYLSYYGAGFVPASGVSRAVWESRRRERLLAQGAIRVAVVSFQIEELSANEARVMFTQSYRSNTYRDRVRKVLRLMWIDDRWQIVEEFVIRQLPW